MIKPQVCVAIPDSESVTYDADIVPRVGDLITIPGHNDYKVTWVNHIVRHSKFQGHTVGKYLSEIVVHVETT